MAKKLTTYIIIMSGLVLLFYFAGILGDTPNSVLLNLLLSPEGLATNSFSVAVVAVLSGIAAIVSIVIGATVGNIELVLKGPFALYILNLMWDFLSVYNQVAAANPVIATLLFAPVLILFGVTIVEWWSGND